MIRDEAFESTFTEVLEEILGWDLELVDEDSPRTVQGWDSLAQIRLVHELETRFEVRLPDDALLEEQSVWAAPTLAVAAARMVTTTGAVAALQGDSWPAVVSVSVTVPAVLSAVVRL